MGTPSAGSPYTTFFVPFSTNVSDPATGSYFKFQPFADLRLRLAFADSIDLNALNQQANNNLGQVAINVVPPGLPPEGVYNSSLLPRYSYNLNNSKNLLLQAMLNPITSFTFANGTELREDFSTIRLVVAD